MEMKWHPIVNGDLSEVPLFDDVLFTIINEDTGGLYVICDELDYETFTEDGSAVFYKWVLDRSEKVLAWAELPEPYKQGGCDMCKHLKQWTDEFGDRLSQCELWPEYKPEDCPIKKEV